MVCKHVLSTEINDFPDQLTLDSVCDLVLIVVRYLI